MLWWIDREESEGCVITHPSLFSLSIHHNIFPTYNIADRFLSFFSHVSDLILAIFWPKNVRIQRTETLDRKVLTPTSWWWSGNQIPSKVEPHPPSTSMVEDLHMQRYQCFAKLVFNAKTRFTKHWSTQGIWEKPIQNTPGVQQRS